jgi:hypothetical protein
MDTGRCPNCGAAYALVGLRHNCRPYSGPVAPTEQQVVGSTSKPVGPTLTNNQDDWMSRALMAEAEVTRLRALLDAQRAMKAASQARRRAKRRVG